MNLQSTEIQILLQKNGRAVSHAQGDQEPNFFSSDFHTNSRGGHWVAHYCISTGSIICLELRKTESVKGMKAEGF